MDLTLEQVLAIGKSIHERIAAGVPLGIMGSKYDKCTWGLCTHARDVYDKPEYHGNPERFVKEGHISALHPPRHVLCALNAGIAHKYGCVAQCVAFNPEHGPLTKQYALGLWDIWITDVEKRIVNADKEG